MKIARVLVIVAVAGANLWAENAPVQKATVVVCIESDPNIMRGALQLASEIFAGIGVKIDWREHTCPVGVGAVVVSLSYDPPDNERTKILAFAQPYEGTHIVVFPDRFRKLDLRQRLCTQAHVLVHEITHILEGTDRHSATGIMKARWDQGDSAEMRHKPLPFTQDDIDLIYLGLKMRQAPLATVRPATVSLLTVASQ